MRYFGPDWLMPGVARQMWRVALSSRHYNGLATAENLRLMNRCTGFHLGTGTKLILTLDSGMHTSGWWKNPDYERCHHLSVSFVDPLTGAPRDRDKALTSDWLEVFFGENQRFLWAEPPYSPDGKRNDVWHYRVFCDPAWNPIIPRGEVYTREFTERGWKSFSDLNSEIAKALAVLQPAPGEQ